MVWFGMVWYGLVKILKLNSRPLINHKGGHRAARAAKKYLKSVVYVMI